jgi:hypothetical protein
MKTAIKSLILLLLCAMLSVGFGQTKPDFSQIKNKPTVFVGDYSGDDQTKLSAAIDAVRDNGSILLEPAALYSLSAPLVIATGVTIIGNNATLQLTASAPYVISFTATSTLKIKDLTIDANNKNTGNSALAVFHSLGVSVEHSTICNSLSNGIWIFNNNQNIFISNNDICSNTYTGLLVEGDSVGEFGEPAEENVACIITNNRVRDSSEQNGIFIAHALQNVIISGNLVYNSGDEGIELGGAYGSYGGKTLSITGNNIFNSSSYKSTGAGIFVRRSSNVVVSNNIIEGSGGYGVQVLDSNYVYGDNNIISISSSYGVYVEDSDYVNLSAATLGCSGTARLYDSKRITLNIEDSSPLPGISFDHTEFGFGELVDCHVNIVSSNTIPIYKTKWGLYYTLTSTESVLSNVVTHSLIPGFFIGDQVSPWVDSGLSSLSVVDNTALMSSTISYRALQYIASDALLMYSNQYIFSFDYENENADAMVYILSYDGVDTYTSLAESIPVGSGTFSACCRPSPIYDDLYVRFFPNTTGGTGTLKIKNVSMFQPRSPKNLNINDLNNF